MSRPLDAATELGAFASYDHALDAAIAAYWQNRPAPNPPTPLEEHR